MMKKTKIVATIGPASDNRETLTELIESGMNVVRINFSHGTHESNGKVIDLVREISKEKQCSVGIMVDLQGPRIRVGNLEPFEIEKGELIHVSDKKTTGEKELVIDSDGVAEALQSGERILIEDGLMELRVVERSGETVKAEVINGGTIKPRKGINLPDTILHFGAVTKKDEEDLAFAMKKEVDFIALSFVSNAKEVKETREKIKKLLERLENLPGIVSKIERKEAIRNIDEIIEVSDVVMVARGDLGIELDETKVVIYQKQIIEKCVKAARPVIVATQMLDSMIQNPIPTRAEVSDVSNAVIDRTDAVMLSGESANGKFPVKAVETMSKIISDTEKSRFDDREIESPKKEEDMEYVAVVKTAIDMAKNSHAKAILAVTERGHTAKLLSHFRPEQRILAATRHEKTYFKTSMYWGVEPYLFSGDNLEEFIYEMIEKAKVEGKLKSKDKIIIIFGVIPGTQEKMRLVGIKEIV